MSQEVERKYLVVEDSWRAEVVQVVHIVQGYVSIDSRAVVRARIRDDQAFLTIKGTRSGISRAEFEYEIPVADAQEMLANLAGPGVIDKHRHIVRHAGRKWEVDVFHGENEGLVMAEVELESPDAVVDVPSWVGADVSDDPRYYNAALSKAPFATW